MHNESFWCSLCTAYFCYEIHRGIFCSSNSVYDADMLIIDNSDIDKTTELVTSILGIIALQITVFKFMCSGQNEPYLKSNVTILKIMSD